MKRPLLLSGFEPFGGATRNPAAEVLRALAGQSIGGVAIETLLLPVSFRAAARKLRTRLKRAPRPRAVVALGLAGGRAAIGIERVAINLIDARIADNDGRQPIDHPVRRGGPSAYFSTLPVKAMLAAARTADLPVELSLSAGSYVCNALMYQLLDALAGTRIPAGFIHLPWLPEQSPPGVPALPLQTQVQVLQTLLNCVMEQPTAPITGLSAGREH